MKKASLTALMVSTAAILGVSATAFMQPGTTPPNQPSRPNQPNQPVQPTDRQPADRPNDRQPADRGAQPRDGNRYMRPFAFESPDYEARFNESSRKLVSMEQRMATKNQELLRKLGEARQLTGEKQNAAVLDVLQQVLLEHGQLQQYLVQSRTAWTGDLDTSTLSNPGDTKNPSDRTTNPDRKPGEPVDPNRPDPNRPDPNRPR